MNKNLSNSPFVVSNGERGIFLPITADEVKRRGWDSVDVVLVSGDAYVDHPAFGTAVLGRSLEAAGYKVAIIAQPNWRDDLRDFKKFGAPRLFFGVTSGCMDSMVNHYTAAKRLRHNDAYTPGGEAGFRPDRATYVYTRILRQLYPSSTIIIGGIEASMRRLAHYDYWSDSLMPSILSDTPANMMIYGMGEQTIVELADSLNNGTPIDNLHSIPQTAFLTTADEPLPKETIRLHSFEQCLQSKRMQAENFAIIERESNKIVQRPLCQEHGEKVVVVNPAAMPPTQEQLDFTYSLPFTRLPHPKYRKRGAIPAYEMIKHSVNSHRGCFGGCSFCTISAHQGKQVVSRSEASIMKEIEHIVAMPDFHGTITDLGGPSANMYGMSGKDKKLCMTCSRYSCIHPKHCPNLNSDHGKLIALYNKVAAIKGVKHLYIGSGIRCDLFNDHNKGYDYFRHVVIHNVSGRLKVAPEHTSAKVLGLMRKPTFDLFLRMKKDFDNICRQEGLPYQLIPYFISSHPGCSMSDMAELAVEMKRLGYRLEQIQDFTPTPMTLSTEMYYTGIDPITMKNIYIAKSAKDKHAQNIMFFYYKRELREEIKRELTRTHNERFIKLLFRD